MDAEPKNPRIRKDGLEPWYELRLLSGNAGSASDNRNAAVGHSAVADNIPHSKGMC